MSIRIGINGLCRMGRVAPRAAWGRSEVEFVHLDLLTAAFSTTNVLAPIVMAGKGLG